MHGNFPRKSKLHCKVCKYCSSCEHGECADKKFLGGDRIHFLLVMACHPEQQSYQRDIQGVLRGKCKESCLEKCSLFVRDDENENTACQRGVNTVGAHHDSIQE